jgi:tight adherence protein C
MQQRLRRATRAGGANSTLSRPLTERMLHPLGNYLSGRTETGRVRGLQSRLNAAGRPYDFTVSRLLALKAVVGVAVTLAMAAILLGMGVTFLVFPRVPSAVILAVLFGLVGYMAPDLWLLQAARDRRAAIRAQLSDVCDLLSVFIDAGAPFDTALERLVDAPFMGGPLIDELATVARSTELGAGRAEALTVMAQRVGVDE